MIHTTATTIAEYIAGFPEAVQRKLKQLHAAVKAAAPDATEAIKYDMPTFVLHGNLVHFAAFQHHIGFYPGPSGLRPFATEIAAYKTGKGSVQFPLTAPLPLQLVKKIVALRVAENHQAALLKKPKRRNA